MARYWDHLRVFIQLNIYKLHPFRAGGLALNAPDPVRAAAAISWHGQYEETAIGYEAGWPGVFHNTGK